MNIPAAMAAASPIHGLPETRVTEAAAKAPASIIPSRPMLITPDRSENSPPIAARMSGVGSRTVDASSCSVKMSLTVLCSLHEPDSLEGVAEHRLGGDEQD